MPKIPKYWYCFCGKCIANKEQYKTAHLRTHVKTGELVEFSTYIHKNGKKKNISVFELTSRLTYSISYAGGTRAILLHLPNAETAAQYIWEYMTQGGVPFFNRSPGYALYKYLEPKFKEKELGENKHEIINR